MKYQADFACSSSFCNKDTAVLDDGIVQEFHYGDEDLQAALSDMHGFFKFSLDIDLFFDLLDSLSEISLGLLSKISTMST